MLIASPLLIACKARYSAAQGAGRLRFSAGLHAIPHPDKRAKGGEDASFAGERLLVAADGVGGWAEQGVDPALYSRSLVENVTRLFGADEEKYLAAPKALVADAAARVTAQGSSTLVLATLSADGTLRTANVGDSGYVVLRASDSQRFELQFKSKEQTHGFNFPYQLGSHGDKPDCAQTAQHALARDDVVVLGSDGLFDNMTAQEVVAVVEDCAREGPLVPAAVARRVAEAAQRHAENPARDSPFALNARKAGLHYRGGKVDDITVVVGRVV